MEVVAAAPVLLDLRWLLIRRLFEGIDDLPTAIVKWDQ
jgi:hypothetical protein